MHRLTIVTAIDYFFLIKAGVQCVIFCIGSVEDYRKICAARSWGKESVEEALRTPQTETFTLWGLIETAEKNAFKNWIHIGLIRVQPARPSDFCKGAIGQATRVEGLPRIHKQVKSYIFLGKRSLLCIGGEGGVHLDLPGAKTSKKCLPPDFCWKVT